MPLEPFGTDQDVSRLIQYQGTVYKIKILYEDHSVIQSTCTRTVTHNELEQVIRAVLYMDQRGTDFGSLKPVITPHFIIRIQKKYWKTSEKIGFKKNGKLLKTFNNYFEFHVKARVDKIQNEQENPEKANTSEQQSTERTNTRKTRTSSESVQESVNAERSEAVNCVTESNSTSAGSLKRKKSTANETSLQGKSCSSHKKKSNYKDTQTDSVNIEPVSKMTRSSSQYFSADLNGDEIDIQEGGINSPSPTTCPPKLQSQHSKSKQRKTVQRDQGRGKSIDHSSQSSAQSDTDDGKRSRRCSSVNRRKMSLRGYDSQTDTEYEPTQTESEYEPSPEQQKNKQKGKRKTAARGKIDLETDSDTNSPVTRSRKKLLNRSCRNKRNSSISDGEQSCSFKGQNLGVKKIKQSRRSSLRNRQKQAKEEDHVNVDNILGVSYKVTKFQKKLAQNRQKEMAVPQRKQRHRLYNQADELITSLPQVIDKNSPGQSTCKSLKLNPVVVLNKESLNVNKTPESDISVKHIVGPIQVKKIKSNRNLNLDTESEAKMYGNSDTEDASENSTPVSRYIKNLPNDTPGSDRQLRSKKERAGSTQKRKSSGMWNFVEAVLTPIKRLMGAGNGD